VNQQPSLALEQRLWSLGYARIAGVDEAGRGAWAGPVVAAAVILPSLRSNPALMDALAPVRDSKLLTPRQRDLCFDLIRRTALCYAVGSTSPDQIDAIGIVPATRRAMQQAIRALALAPDHLLIDALALPALPVPQIYRPKGDRDCLSIAAASVVAKVSRDREMVGLDHVLPGYGLARHKGYGTPQHIQALHALGPTPLHRHSFAPIKALDQGRDLRIE
jgi:ribonuclease HII